MSSILLTPEDVAERLAVNAATVRAWLRKGNLKGKKIGRKVWRISEDELNAFLSRTDIYSYNIDIVKQGSYGNDLPDQVRENQSELKESIIKDLDELSARNLERIHDLVIDLKEQEAGIKSDGAPDAYMRVRQALSGFSGSLTDDLFRERNDRL